MKTQEFLAAAGIEAKTIVDAKKDTHSKPEAIELLGAITDLHAAKGKKVVHLNLKKDEPTEEEMLKLVLGPTGNLRAPTLRVGKKLVVGFNQAMYESVFG